MGLATPKAVIIGLVTEVGEEQVSASGAAPGFRKIARLDLIGELSGAGRFQRGVTEYPNIGDAASLLTERELRLVYGAAEADHAHVGDLQQSPNIGVHIDIDHLMSRHFAILGATGVGKSTGVAIILQKILDTRPNLRIFLVDPHNEYSRCFGDKAQALTPRNLRLPFWLFNFEETIDAFLGARPGVDEEVEILSEVIPLAKAAYLQYRANGNDRLFAKRRDPSYLWIPGSRAAHARRNDAALLHRHYIDERRHAAVAETFIDDRLVDADIERGEIGEGLFQQLACVKIFDLRRPAGSVVELLRRVALEQQEPARLQRPLDADEDRLALCRRGELEKDRRHDVERIYRIAPIDHVGLFDAQRHAALLCQLARLLLRVRREIERQHVEALLGEEDAVAPFAIGNRQRGLALAQQMRLRFEKRVRRGAEPVLLAREPRLPVIEVGVVSHAGASQLSCAGLTHASRLGGQGFAFLIGMAGASRP
jgi:Helicase HerA, central domain